MNCTYLSFSPRSSLFIDRQTDRYTHNLECQKIILEAFPKGRIQYLIATKIIPADHSSVPLVTHTVGQ